MRWNHLPSILAAVTLAVTSGFVVSNEARPALARVGDVEFVDLPAEFADIARWAVSLFDEADLSLPPLQFVHHRVGQTACSDRRGVHEYVNGRSTIHVCTSDPGNATEALILHETAHAWAAHSLSDERKADFRALRGWTYWRNHREAEWYENGSEQAAEMILWGLIDRPVGIVTIREHTCEDLDAGYRALTGQPPLHGFRDHC